MPNAQLLGAILLTILLIFLLLGGVIVAIVTSHRRIERNRQEMAQLELDYQKELRSIEAEVQEATLTNIAAELHDNIGQLLTYMRLQLEKEKLCRPEIGAVLQPISVTLKDTMQQVRLLSHSLSHDFITDGGLQRVIGQEVERLQGLGKHRICFETDAEEPDMPRDAQLVAFRIFQEALNNALRHADARTISITLKGETPFCLRLQDDGKGFEQADALYGSTGFGLKNMLRRATLAGLRCSIRTAPQEGCTFTITSLAAAVPA